jgi:hypothetical protein
MARVPPGHPHASAVDRADEPRADPRGRAVRRSPLPFDMLVATLRAARV